jgi:polysaccharide export outer membrane protein
MAKDLTVYKRKNILIIREVDGVKTFNRVDTQRYFEFSFFIIWHKMMWCVEPNQNKINVGAVNPSIGLVFSVISILITLTTLIITFKLNCFHGK